MSTYRIGVMRGDGIGPEIVQACVTIFESAMCLTPTISYELVECPMGLDAIRRYGSALPDESRALLKTCDCWIMGPHDNASYPAEERKKHRNPSGELRHSLDLYANIRPSRALPGIDAVAPHMDLVIVRENTEEFYPDRNMVVGSGESMPTPDIALCTGVFTRRAATRIARTAFDMAQRRRKHVTIVHKANVITLGFGLFIEACREVAKDYPEVRVDDYHVDAMAAHLVRRASDFDVVVTTNMLGDILSDLAGELAGSLGLSPSINASDTIAMAQAVHGSAPDIAGRGIANPTGITLSLVMLLDWLAAKHNDTALMTVSRRIEHAIQQVYADGIRTADLGGNTSTTEFANAVIAQLS
ncbi:MAG TPA: 3-isopropylmalate dehydrogenase [Ktedonobacter sp.]|nr:3-isopropylmalate dehydrogenase [Ktedonobacter sp.]